MNRHLPCMLFIVLLAPATVSGQKPKQAEKPQGPDQPQLFKLSVDPMSQPVPALKHSLVPSYLDLKSGNAVPYYYRAVVSWKDVALRKDKAFLDEFKRLRDTPIEEISKKELRKFLQQGLGAALNELETAASRERCDWDWRMRDLSGFDGIAFLLPEVQPMRDLGRLLALKVRLQIMEGRHEEALRLLTIGYKLAVDVSEPPTLINDLVGMSIASKLNAEVLNLINSPGAPNLYWALSQLPDPLIDIRPALQYENALPFQMFPFLKDSETAQRTPAEWQAQLDRAIQQLHEMRGLFDSGPQKVDPWPNTAELKKRIKDNYPRAKRELIESGMERERVGKMPLAQVIAIHQSRVNKHLYQEIYKWTLLPFWQARTGLEASEKKLKEEGYLKPPRETREILPLSSQLLPATFAARLAAVRVRNQIAGLRTLEAIRMHAAANGGKLPKRLADISEVPVPMSPASGKPLDYRMEDGRAILDIPSAPLRPASSGWRLVISVSPKR